jgi:hypothetical protein
MTCIMYQQLWGYKVEEKLYVGVREQKRFNTTAVDASVHTLVVKDVSPVSELTWDK